MAIIEIENISKKYKNNVLYEATSLVIEKGETVGIVGMNGSGKSVLFKMIAGLENPDSGKIYVRGEEVGQNFDFPKNLGILVNQPGYIEYYDGFTNLKMLAEIQGKINDDTIRHYMEKVGLKPDDKTRVKNYSSGMKQKLGIAQAIMEGQDIILLDEPFNALDFQTNKEIVDILTELKKEEKTVILTSHQHSYLEKTCNKMYIILGNQIKLFSDEIKEKYFDLIGL